METFAVQAYYDPGVGEEFVVGFKLPHVLVLAVRHGGSPGKTPLNVLVVALLLSKPAAASM